MFLGWSIFLCILGIMSMGQIMGENTLKENPDNYTIIQNNIRKTLDDVSINVSDSFVLDNINYTNMSIAEINSARIGNIILKGAETLVFIGLETSKIGFDYGYSHPDIDFYVFIKWIMILLGIGILLQVIGAFPFVAAIIYFIYLGIHKLYIVIKNKFTK